MVLYVRDVRRKCLQVLCLQCDSGKAVRHISLSDTDTGRQLVAPRW